MSSNQKHSGIKSTLEFGPVIIFFLAYILFDRSDISLNIYGQTYEGFVLATTIFIPIILITTFLTWKLTGEVSKMQLFTAILVVVFGGMTILFNDDRFFKMKPTLVYFLFGFVLLVGLLRGKSYLESLMGTMLPMEREGWMIISRRITGFFFFLGLLNEFVWRTFSTEVWVYFKTFGLSIALFVFLASQFSVLSKYGDFGNDDKK